MTETTSNVVRWAILGTGAIANDMVQILKQLPQCEVIAVGSRSVEGAKRFGDRWGIPRQYASYEEAASDKDVDVCYIATPSLRHPQDCLLAIENGKAVLCEKSMAPNDEIAKEIFFAAKEANVLVVHGVWSRFFPVMQKIRQIIESGEIGEVRSARASFCQNDGAGSCSALLETGIYCAQFLQWALDDPNRTNIDGSNNPIVRGACRTIHESGKDEHVTAIIEFPGNKIGSFECSLAHCSDRSAAIYGSCGVIEVPFPFW
jgi:dihydrodiol dehydrogenase / D-xylose 1-dehydrogenase (NADP)